MSILRKDNTVLKFENSILNISNKYNGPFLFLNNFDNIINDVSYSEIGPNLNIPPEILKTESSNVFAGLNCLKMYNYSSSITGAYTQNAITTNENILTIETYYSNYYSYYGSLAYTECVCGLIGFETENNDFYRIQVSKFGTVNYTTYNGTSYFAEDGVAKYFHIPIRPINSCHEAAVIDYENKTLYVFCNGTLYLKCTYSEQPNKVFNIIKFSRETYPVYTGINFIAIRKGDWSNNLESFTVPTQKYHL